jgi:predicted transcriptional regulator
MISTMPSNPAAQPSAEMLKMLNAFLTVQALHVAAFLGIADMLAAGPKSLDDLASKTKADRSSLHRLLRMLTGPGVFWSRRTGALRSHRSARHSEATAPIRSASGRSSWGRRRCGRYGPDSATVS